MQPPQCRSAAAPPVVTPNPHHRHPATCVPQSVCLSLCASAWMSLCTQRMCWQGAKTQLVRLRSVILAFTRVTKRTALALCRSSSAWCTTTSVADPSPPAPRKNRRTTEPCATTRSPATHFRTRFGGSYQTAGTDVVFSPLDRTVNENDTAIDPDGRVRDSGSATSRPITSAMFVSATADGLGSTDLAGSACAAIDVVLVDGLLPMEMVLVLSCRGSCT